MSSHSSGECVWGGGGRIAQWRVHIWRRRRYRLNTVRPTSLLSPRTPRIAHEWRSRRVAEAGGALESDTCTLALY
eukprot:COSAG06_NODE_104_length_23856_cov_6.259629_7_plen_75_part_00